MTSRPIGEHFDADGSQPAITRYRFSRAMRLGTANDYRAVYSANVRKHVGPLAVFARPNALGHLRLGLGVSRRVGNAVTRNAIKRRLREAFRLMQHDLPTGYDIVVRVRTHELLSLAEYQRMLSKATRRLHQRWAALADEAGDHDE